MQAEVYCPLLLLFAACVGAQTINIYDLEEKYSSCKTGMITEIDRYVLYADVDLTYGSDRWFKVIIFQIKNSDSSQFVRICLLNLERGCRNRYCSCKNKLTANQTKFAIIINITAYVDKSEAEIRGVLTNVNRIPMYSNTVKLPVIYDLSKRILQVNNLTISPNQISYQLKQTDRRLEFCCLNTPSPCVTTVVANHSATTSGDRCTVIDVPPDASYDNVTVVTTVCHSHNFTRVLMLETEDIASTPNTPNCTNVFTKNDPFDRLVTAVAILSAAVLVLIILIILITVFRDKLVICLKFSETNSSQYFKENKNKEKLNSVETSDSDSDKSLKKAINLKGQLRSSELLHNTLEWSSQHDYNNAYQSYYTP